MPQSLRYKGRHPRATGGASVTRGVVRAEHGIEIGVVVACRFHRLHGFRLAEVSGIGTTVGARTRPGSFRPTAHGRGDGGFEMRAARSHG